MTDKAWYSSSSTGAAVLKLWLHLESFPAHREAWLIPYIQAIGVLPGTSCFPRHHENHTELHPEQHVMQIEQEVKSHNRVLTNWDCWRVGKLCNKGIVMWKIGRTTAVWNKTLMMESSWIRAKDKLQPHSLYSREPVLDADQVTGQKRIHRKTFNLVPLWFF